MKKMMSFALVLAMLAALLAGCASGGSNETTDGTTAATTVETTVETTAETTVETTEETTSTVSEGSACTVILENIWNAIPDDQKFAVRGGNVENYVDGAPGDFNLVEYRENLTYELLVPENRLDTIAEVGCMFHFMNTNNLTIGVYKLVEGEDPVEFGQVMRDVIQNNQWMCGFPEQLVITVIDETYVFVGFGINDAMNPIVEKLGELYPDANELFNEEIMG